MNSFEANKIFGAVLGTIFVLFGGSILAEGLFHAEAPETPGFEIVVAEAEGGAEGAPAEEAAVPIAALLQTADAEAGASEFRKCSACHTAEQGGANKVGPHLWDVVNRPIASVSDFSYSSAMQEFSEGGTVVWDYDHLSYFIENPKGHVPGTAMGFAGLKDPEARASLIAYLRTLAENPAPLPEAPVAEAAPAAAEVTDPATSTDATAGEAAQSPGVTDTDAAQPAPGAEAAPVQAADAQPETPAEAAQAANAPAAPTGGDTTAGAQGTVAEGAESVAAAAAPAAPAPAAPPAAIAPPAAAPAAATPPAATAPAAETPAAIPEAAAPAPEAAAVPAAEPVAVAGDPAAGKSSFRKCAACHAVGEGAANKIGPELNGIVGEAVASVEGYSFSPALTAYAADHPTWTPELLTQWLENPRQLVPGTKMVFPGIRDADEIANIIAYLSTFDETGAAAN